MFPPRSTSQVAGLSRRLSSNLCRERNSRSRHRSRATNLSSQLFDLFSPAWRRSNEDGARSSRARHCRSQGKPRHTLVAHSEQISCQTRARYALQDHVWPGANLHSSDSPGLGSSAHAIMPVKEACDCGCSFARHRELCDITAEKRSRKSRSQRRLLELLNRELTVHPEDSGSASWRRPGP